MRLARELHKPEGNCDCVWQCRLGYSPKNHPGREEPSLLGGTRTEMHYPAHVTCSRRTSSSRDSRQRNAWRCGAMIQSHSLKFYEEVPDAKRITPGSTLCPAKPAPTPPPIYPCSLQRRSLFSPLKIPLFISIQRDRAQGMNTQNLSLKHIVSLAVYFQFILGFSMKEKARCSTSGCRSTSGLNRVRGSWCLSTGLTRKPERPRCPLGLR